MLAICNECRAMHDVKSLSERCPSCGETDTFEAVMTCADCGAAIPYSESVILRASRRAYCDGCVRERVGWLRELLCYG
jgi:hypothetical protein